MNEISSLRFKKESQQKNNLSSDYLKKSGDTESFDTSFQNQIKDNQNQEFENNFYHNEDIEEKAVRNRLTDETNFSTSPLLAQTELFPSHQKYNPSIRETDDTFEQVEELTAGLKEAIEEAPRKKHIKQKLS
ncbi:MAG: hypothetical protein WKF97_05990 [Chitinophagaceae bacterium]